MQTNTKFKSIMDAQNNYEKIFNKNILKKDFINRAHLTAVAHCTMDSSPRTTLL